MIPLYLNKGVAYVWSSEDWYKLRTEHRICGSLIGSIPSYPRQNDFLGLPMALMGVEAALLIESQICELYSLTNLNNKLSDEEKQNLKEQEEGLIEEQTEALRKNRIEQMSQKIDMIMVGKRKKLLAKGLTDVEIDKETLIQEEISKLPALNPAYLLVHLPTEHHFETEKIKLSMEDLCPSVLEGDGAIKYNVYKNLWSKGHYITEGLKFGCDFLVYPGDPVKFHAMYMVRCVNDESTCFPASNIVAFGRLSVAVNKLAVLASVAQGQVEYQTLQWHDSVNG